MGNTHTYTILLLFICLNGFAQDTDKIYATPEVPPSFSTHTDSLRNYIKNHLIYPKNIPNENYSAIIRFVVEKDGTITNLVYIKHTNQEVENEIQKLLNNMPKWTPAKVKDIPVRCYYVMQIKLCPEGCYSW